MFYNIYYLNNKINNKPLTEKEVLMVIQNKYIKKLNNITKELYDIPVDKIKILKCTII